MKLESFAGAAKISALSREAHKEFEDDSEH